MLLTNSQYDQLMIKYYDRQFYSQHLLDKRQEEVLAAIPEIRDLNEQIQTLSLSYAKAALSHNPQSVNLQDEIARITAQKEQLLADHGFPSDYLEPVYHCPDCRDTGYIGNLKCHCFEREIINYLYAQSNLQEILEKENFSHFDLHLYPDDYTEEATGETPRDNMKKVLKTAQDFVKNFDSHHDNLLLYGSTGVGKTFLSHCIAKELLDRSHTVVYLTALKLFDILETYKFDRDLSQTEKNATVTYILDSDLLIIDDLGTELNNSFTSSQLYHCIDTRLNRNLSTIISTNLSFDALQEQYSERIFSRITSNYKLRKITGDDIRLKKAIMQGGNQT